MRERCGRDPRRNVSMCMDFTAFDAIESVTADERRAAAGDKRASDLIFVLKYIIRMAGFELRERIAVRDKRTGKEYR